jgi:S1-C subfamily serine protease
VVSNAVGNDEGKVTVTLPGSRDVPAHIVGVDELTDLALLKVADVRDLPTLPWGDSSQLKLAEWVLAIGNPFSIGQTVTLGIVSATKRNLQGQISGYEDFIQTDAAINPGNSGGALINARGELVGINSAIYSETGGYQGIGFAIPSNLARRIMNDLQKYGAVRRGSIGRVDVTAVTPQFAQEIGARDTKGALVYQMARSSEAYVAGLRPGDVIVGFNNQPVDDPSQFLRLLSDAPIGSTVKLGIVRDGRRMEISVKINAASRRRP